MPAAAPADVQQRAQAPRGEPDAVAGDDARGGAGRVERPAGVLLAHLGHAQDAEVLLVGAEDLLGHRVDHLGARAGRPAAPCPAERSLLRRDRRRPRAARGDHVPLDGGEQRDQPLAQRAAKPPDTGRPPLPGAARRREQRRQARPPPDEPPRAHPYPAACIPGTDPPFPAQGLTPGGCRRRGSSWRACCG